MIHPSWQRVSAPLFALLFAIAIPSAFASTDFHTYEDYVAYAKVVGLDSHDIISAEQWKQPAYRQRAITEVYRVAKEKNIPTHSGTHAKPVQVPNDDNPYEQEARGKEGAFLGGHYYTKAAASGLRGSALLHSAGGKAEAVQLRKTSRILHRNGQVAEVSTYAGYASGAASIGAAAATYLTRDQSSNKTAEAVNDIAAKASFGIGAINIASGTLGYIKAADYKNKGLKKIEQMEKDLKPGAPGYEERKRALAGARERFEFARKEANEASAGLLFRGAGNVVIGGAAIFVKKKVVVDEEKLKSLENSSSTASTNVVRTATTSTATAATSATGSASASPQAPAPPGERNYPINPQGPTTLVPTSPNLAGNGVATATGPLTSSGSSPTGGASVDPDRRRGRNSGTTNTGVGAPTGVIAALSGAPGGTGSGEEAPSEANQEGAPEGEARAQEGVTDATGYSGGGGAIRLAGDAPDEGNPIADVFGQLGQMIHGDKDAENAGGYTGRDPASHSGNHSAPESQNIVVDAEADIFKTHRAKMFQMKYRGNL